MPCLEVADRKLCFGRLLVTEWHLCSTDSVLLLCQCQGLTVQPVHMMLYTLYTRSTVNTSLATITHSLRSCWLGPLDSSWLYPTSYTYLYINMITICKKCFILCKWLIMIRPHFVRKDVVILRFRFRTRTGNFFCKIHHWELKYHKSSKNTLYSKLTDLT